MRAKTGISSRIILIVTLLMLLSQSIFSQSLNALDFQKKMAALPNAPIVDVRTPGEFNQSHIRNAVNININDYSFPTQIGKYSKSKPLLVYCLSGSRSSYALQYLISQGFKEVYELNGGLIRWRAAGLPETSTGNSVSSELTDLQFKKLINSDKIVLVDFYADWCAPCKKMAPHLEEIKKEMADKVSVVKINADQNKSILQAYKITSIPTLQVYKNGKIIWTNVGYITKEEIVSKLK